MVKSKLRYRIVRRFDSRFYRNFELASNCHLLYKLVLEHFIDTYQCALCKRQMDKSDQETIGLAD